MPFGAFAMKASYDGGSCQLLGSPRALERWMVELYQVTDYWIREYRDLSKLGTRRNVEPSFRNGHGPLSSAILGPPALTPASSYAVHCCSAVCPAAIGHLRHHSVSQSSPGTNCWSHSSILSWISERLEGRSGWLVIGVKLLRSLLASPVSCLPAHSRIVLGGRADVDTQAQAFAYVAPLC